MKPLKFRAWAISNANGKFDTYGFGYDWPRIFARDPKGEFLQDGQRIVRVVLTITAAKRAKRGRR